MKIYYALLIALTLLVNSCITYDHNNSEPYLSDKIDKFENTRTIYSPIIDTSWTITDFARNYNRVIPSDGSVEISICTNRNQKLHPAINYFRVIDRKNRPHTTIVENMKILIDNNITELVPVFQKDVSVEKFFWLYVDFEFDINIFSNLKDNSEISIRVTTSDGMLSDYYLDRLGKKNLHNYLSYISKIL